MTVPQPTIARILLMSGHLARRAAGAAIVLALLGSLLAVRVQAQPMGEPPAKGIILSVNASRRHQMTTKKRIARVVVSDDRVLQVTGTEMPEEVFFTGRAPGAATVTLTDSDGKVEVITVVVVTFDIRQVEESIRRTVPTANIQLVPAGNYSIVLKGNVDRLEDLQLAREAAESIIGEAAQRAGASVRIINGLRVGGPQQVQLDVVVAQVSRAEFRAMAFNFLANSKNFFFGSTVGQAVVNPVLVGIGGSLNVAGLPAQGLAGVPGTPTGFPTDILSGVIHNGWGFLHFLQALRTEGVVKNLAEPKLVTLSGRQASFLSGGEQAIPVPAGLGQIGVQFEEFGTRLNFVPVVLGNGKIHLEVEPEVSDLNPAFGTSISGTVVPGRTTQRARTTVEMEAGQTFVIGGLIQHRVRGDTQKIPILGDLPFVGTLFSSKDFSEDEQEILIIVTPYLVDPMDCAQFPKVLPGQETRSPDDFELFLEGILEAPRGARDVCHGKHYVPAYMNDPTVGQYPCAGGDHDGHHGGHHSGRFGGGHGCPTCPGGMHSKMGAGEMTMPPAAMRQMPEAPEPITKQELQPSQPEPIGPPTPSAAPGVKPASMPAEDVSAPEMPAQEKQDPDKP
jgi:pilus assembly protein CpaC